MTGLHKVSVEGSGATPNPRDDLIRRGDAMNNLPDCYEDVLFAIPAAPRSEIVPPDYLDQDGKASAGIEEYIRGWNDCIDQFKKAEAQQGSSSPSGSPPAKTAVASALCVEATSDAERYRWLNKHHNMLIYIEAANQIRTNCRLRCGEALDTWIDARIAEEREAERDSR